ncbi:MAG: DNA repair protein RecO [Flavobacteriia bacterium]
MKKKDIGFVLHRISYSETSSIIKCFTQEHGLKSFMIQGGKKKYSSVLQAMMPIEFTFYQRNEELAKLYEPSVFVNLNEIQFHPIKSSYLFFEAEILLQCFKDDQIDKEIFRFVLEELMWLNAQENYANYLLFCMIELCDYLGIKPNVLDEKAIDFDLVNGEISSEIIRTSNCISHPEIANFVKVLISEKDTILQLELSKESRKFILNLLFDYFKIHISGFKIPQSLEVYQTIWYD